VGLFCFLSDSMKEEAYILGTDQEELDRLGFQHAVWSKEASRLWHLGGITLGQQMLDLGCGPGFASFDLAQAVGREGKVVGVDISAEYIQYANQQAEQRHLSHASFIETSFDDLEFEENSFDAIYCRWALAWINNVPDVIEKVFRWLKPGGVFMAQEYQHWATFCVSPERPEVRVLVEACREGWKQMESEIDIGVRLPQIMFDAGFNLEHVGPLIRYSNPREMTWQWPGTFLKIYSYKLIELGLLTNEDRERFLPVWEELEKDPQTTFVTPMMMEIIGRKN